MTDQLIRKVEFPTPTLVINILQNEYTLKWPDTGQFIDIELKKVAYAKQQNDGLIAKASVESINVSFTIDMIATFHVLIPQLERDINTPSLFKLPLQQNAHLLNIYLRKIYPWLKQLYEAVNDSVIDTEDEIKGE